MSKVRLLVGKAPYDVRLLVEGESGPELDLVKLFPISEIRLRITPDGARLEMDLDRFWERVAVHGVIADDVVEKLRQAADFLGYELAKR